jgi:prophage regulatory protein
MRILSKKDLRALVLYSPAHIDRLEKAGLFPKRVQLGPCRVGWVESEVLAWLQERMNRRNATITNEPLASLPHNVDR